MIGHRRPRGISGIVISLSALELEQIVGGKIKLPKQLVSGGRSGRITNCNQGQQAVEFLLGNATCTMPNVENERIYTAFGPPRHQTTSITGVVLFTRYRKVACNGLIATVLQCHLSGNLGIPRYLLVIPIYTRALPTNKFNLEDRNQQARGPTFCCGFF